MPTIYKYLGILFIIHTGREHPPPHVHIQYNEFEGVIYIKTGETEGNPPSRVLNIAREFIAKNRFAVLTEWERMEKGESPRRIQIKMN